MFYNRMLRAIAVLALATVSCVHAQMQLQLRPGSPAPTPGDLANGFYPQLPKVDIQSPQFLDVVAWLVEKGAPVPTVNVSVAMLAPGNTGGPVVFPTELWFESAAGAQVRLDAAFLYHFPHVALVDLKQTFGFGDPKVLEIYTRNGRAPVAKPAPVAVSPIGAVWPEQGPNAYRPSANDIFEDGATWQDSTGRYVKRLQQWVFVRFPVWYRE